MRNSLSELDLTVPEFDGILITHEHTDHIKGLGVIARRYGLPIFATGKTIDAIFDYKNLGKVDKSLFHSIEADKPFEIGDMKVNASHIWHDAADPVCYSFYSEEGAKASIATDLGDYDEYLVDAYLEALDEKAPLPKQFDVESSWNQFRSKHSILFDADDILPNPKHSRSFSHKFRFRKAIPQLVAAAAIVGVLGMFGAQAAGIDVFGALGRWTEETFHFVAPKASAAPTYHTVSNGDGFYELEQYSTLQDAFDAYSISDPLAPSWIPEGYTLDYVEVSPSDTEIIFSASYSKEQNTLSFLYSYRKDGTFTSSTFEKDGSSVVEYIQNGITHYIMSNLSVQLSAWVNGNCECSITGPISEKEMIAIIDSIYA